MAHHVFVSYSEQNRAIAEKIVDHLEASGLRCWIAPRDIRFGGDWRDAIMKAIADCDAFVLVFTAESSASDEVGREVAAAVQHKRVVIPLRVHDVRLDGTIGYYLGGVQWLNATTPPIESHLPALVKALKRESGRVAPVDGSGGGSPGTSSSPNRQTERPDEWSPDTASAFRMWSAIIQGSQLSHCLASLVCAVLLIFPPLGDGPTLREDLVKAVVWILTISAGWLVLIGLTGRAPKVLGGAAPSFAFIIPFFGGRFDDLSGGVAVTILVVQAIASAAGLYGHSATVGKTLEQLPPPRTESRPG
jgi:hypothetical protein